MTIRLRTAILATLFSIIVACFSVWTLAYAAPLVNENSFESYSTGDLYAQGWNVNLANGLSSWNFNMFDVVNNPSTCFAGSQCIDTTGNGNGHTGNGSIIKTYSSGVGKIADIDFYVKFSNATASGSGLNIYVDDSSKTGFTATQGFSMQANGGGGWKITDSWITGALETSGLSYNTWHEVDFLVDFTVSSACVITMTVDSVQVYTHTWNCGVSTVNYDSVGIFPNNTVNLDDVLLDTALGGVIDLSTRVISVTPTPDSTVASSTSFTFGATGFENPDDISSSTVLDITYARISDISLGGGFSTELQLPITTSGSFSLSTTTSVLLPGIYEMTTKIQQPKFSIFGFAVPWFYDTWGTVTSQFTVATSTAVEQDMAKQYLKVLKLGTPLGAASTTQDLTESACSTTNILLNLASTTGACLSELFLPSPAFLQSQASTLLGTMSTKVPFGFFALVYKKISDITGSTTPVNGSNVVVNFDNTFLPTGSTTIFSWNDAKNTLSTIAPTSTMKYVVYGEWITFSGYILFRTLTILL